MADAFAPRSKRRFSRTLRSVFILWALLPVAAAVWAAPGQLIRTLEGHTHDVFGVAFSPDNSLLASGSRDTTIKIWRVSDGSLLHTITGHTAPVEAVAFSPDGALLASAAGNAEGYPQTNDRTVRLWRMGDWSCETSLTLHTNWVSGVAFSPDSSTLVSSSYDDTIKYWNVSNGSLLYTTDTHTLGVYCIAYSPRGDVVASGSANKTITLWRASDHALLRTLTGHNSTVWGVAFSPDGSTLASAGSADKAVKLWQVSDGSLLRTIVADTIAVNGVAFSPDGQILASGNGDHTVRLWRVSDGSLLATLNGHSSDVMPVEFSSNGEFLASGSFDHTIKLWTGNAERAYTYQYDALSQMTAAKFKNGRRILYDYDPVGNRHEKIVASQVIISKGPASPGVHDVASDQTNVSLLQLRLTANEEESIDVANVMVAASGNLNDLTGISRLRLFLDVDSSGDLSGPDTLLAEDHFTADNGQILLRPSTNLNIPANTSRDLVFVADFSSSGSLGDTVQLTFSSDAWLGASGHTSGRSIVPLGAPIEGSVVTIGSVLTTPVPSPSPTATPIPSPSPTITPTPVPNLPPLSPPDDPMPTSGTLVLDPLTALTLPAGSDPDGFVVGHFIEVWSEATNERGEASVVDYRSDITGASSVSYQPAQSFSYGLTYKWRARTLDNEGAESPFTGTFSFTVAVPTETPTPSPTLTPSPTESPSPPPSPFLTASPSVSPSPTETATPIPSPSPTQPPSAIGDWILYQ